MPHMALELKCNMVNVDKLRVEDSVEYRWHIKVQCLGCGEIPDTWQYVVLEDLVEIPASRSEAHLVEKCDFCGRTNTLRIMPGTLREYTADKNNQFQEMVVFDCRGMIPVEFDLRDGWTVSSALSPVVFEDIDLFDKTWADYDDRVNEPVEITEIETRFVESPPEGHRGKRRR